MWLQLFREAELEVITEEDQDGMPEELFLVKTYVEYNHASGLYRASLINLSRWALR